MGMKIILGTNNSRNPSLSLSVFHQVIYGFSRVILDKNAVTLNFERAFFQDILWKGRMLHLLEIEFIKIVGIVFEEAKSGFKEMSSCRVTLVGLSTQ
jgi:hypothetical protein